MAVMSRRSTLFNTRWLQRLLQPLASVLMRLSGWRLAGPVPTLKRYVLIAAPHTSNWDFVLMLLAVLKAGIDLRWMGKHSLFRPPFGALMRWLGGIAIDRRKANNVVSQMVDQFAQCDELILLITPEGTRSQVERWKTGFYQIAHGANVPIVLGYVDGERREIGFGEVFMPGGDLEADLAKIQARYAGLRGVRAR
jgi:1-acyl-sn-glycerol-3-phosphate acyltransferase